MNNFVYRKILRNKRINRKYEYRNITKNFTHVSGYVVSFPRDFTTNCRKKLRPQKDTLKKIHIIHELLILSYILYMYGRTRMFLCVCVYILFLL